MASGVGIVGRTIGSLWRGEVPLGQVVLVYAVLIPIILGIPINLQKASFGWIPESTFNNVFFPLYSLFLISYIIFVSICVWRSASNFEGGVIWRAVAKASIIFMVMIVAGFFTYGLFFGASHPQL